MARLPPGDYQAEGSRMMTRRAMMVAAMTAAALGPLCSTAKPAPGAEQGAAAKQNCTFDLPGTAPAGIWGQPVKPDMSPYSAVVNPHASSVTFLFFKRPSVTVFPLGPIPEPTKAVERNLQLHLHKAGMVYLRQCGAA